MHVMIKSLLLILSCVVISGCLNLGGLNYKQVRMLKKQGFELTSEGWSLGLPERLLFGFNQAEIKPEYAVEITQLAQRLQKYHLNRLKIIGYTDDIGALEYNMQLSEKRATNVAQIFFDNQYQPNNIQVIGRGPNNPIVPNTSEENRASNRRVAIIIVP